LLVSPVTTKDHRCEISTLVMPQHAIGSKNFNPPLRI